MYKTYEDIKMVADLGRSDAVLNSFITSYLQGEKLLDLYHSTLDPEAGESFSETDFREWQGVLQQQPDWTPPEVSSTAIDSFRREHYTMLREGGYPPMSMYLDAVVKGDAAQEEEYKSLCLTNKERFPKPLGV